MAAMMNARGRDILQLLLRQRDPMKVDELAKQMNLSKRSVYYDIYHINDWLTSFNLPELNVVRGKGILLSDEEKVRIEELLETASPEEDYVFSPTERIAIIVCSIIYSGSPIYVEQLMSYCGVSRNTIFNDLTVVEGNLQNYDLNMAYEPKTGYFIKGDVIKTRAAFLLFFEDILPLLQENRVKFLDREQVFKNAQLLKEIEEKLHTSYVDGVITSLAALLPIIERGNSGLRIENLRRDEIESTREYALIRETFPDMEWIETIYLCIHLLGSRVTVNANDLFHERPRQQVYETTKALVSEFEKIACVNFRNRETLEQELFAHIGASLYRYQYGIRIGDSIGDDVIREYPDLFEITKLVSKYLEQMIGLPVPDREIAFLALHFGAHLTLPDNQGKRLRILIICVNGVSTGNMIRREVKRLLPDCEIVAVESARTVVNAQDQCDVIISTIKLQSVVPVIQVNPILSQKDRENILSHPRINNHVIRLDIQHLMDVIGPYIQEKDRGIVQEKIEDCLAHNSRIRVPETVKEEKAGLLDLLTEGHIQVLPGAATWLSALREAATPLLQEGSIEERYLETIVSQLQYYGPYMFINPGVLLAHARPEDGVNRLSASMTVLQEPVAFSELQKASVIIVLAASDQESHLGILRDIAELFSIQARVDDLASLDNSDAVRRYLQDMPVLEIE